MKHAAILFQLTLGLTFAFLIFPQNHARADNTVLQRDNGERVTFNTIQQALDEARPGDTVQVPTGVHHEYLRFTTSGEPGRPITLEAVPGEHAVLDGAAPQFQTAPQGKWTPHDYEGERFYRTIVPFDGEPASLAIATWISRTNLPGSNGSEQLLATYASLDALKDGPRGEGSFRRGRTVFVRLADGEDPNEVPLNIGRSAAVIDIGTQSHIRIRNLEIRNAGWVGIRMGNAASDNPEFAGTAELDKADLAAQAVYGNIELNDLLIRNAFRGIAAGAERGDNVLIRGVTITNGIHRDEWPRAGGYSPGVGQASGNSSDALAPFRGFGIRLTNVANSTIRDCVISGHWDGIGVKQSDHVRIHHNTIRDIMDDGIELESLNQSNIYFYNNHIYNVFAGISVTANDPGPIYVFRNVIEVTRPRATGSVPSYGIKSGHDNYGLASNIKFYHNTFYSGIYAVWEKYGDPAPNRWHGYDFVNNVFYTIHPERANYNFRGKDAEDDGGDNHWEGNFYNRSNPASEHLSHTLPDMENYFANLEVECVTHPRDLRLKSDTPEKHTGSDYVLRQGWEDSVEVTAGMITRGAWAPNMKSHDIGASADLLKRVHDGF